MIGKEGNKHAKEKQALIPKENTPETSFTLKEHFKKMIIRTHVLEDEMIKRR